MKKMICRAIGMAMLVFIICYLISLFVALGLEGTIILIAFVATVLVWIFIALTLISGDEYDKT